MQVSREFSVPEVKGAATEVFGPTVFTPMIRRFVRFEATFFASPRRVSAVYDLVFATRRRSTIARGGDTAGFRPKLKGAAEEGLRGQVAEGEEPSEDPDVSKKVCRDRVLIAGLRIKVETWTWRAA